MIEYDIIELDIIELLQDEIAYLVAGIPKNNIWIIDPHGIIYLKNKETTS